MAEVKKVEKPKIVEGVDSKGNKVVVSLVELEKMVGRVKSRKAKVKKVFPEPTHFRCAQCKQVWLLKERVAIKVDFDIGKGNPNAREALQTFPRFIQICKTCERKINAGWKK